ncbi:unnamed protein product [Pleuronectes platessa]|uniref:Uncharacterized protein n=1 Tax=Pleuronectes platessa TaxID=8262 RepID=A0A9N7UP80_PLEPL|nr:unnamed protein product [Pleuronectes platessa]
MEGWRDGWMEKGWLDGGMAQRNTCGYFQEAARASIYGAGSPSGERGGGMELERDGGMELERDGGMELESDGGMDGSRCASRRRRRGERESRR